MQVMVIFVVNRMKVVPYLRGIDTIPRILPRMTDLQQVLVVPYLRGIDTTNL